MVRARVTSDKQYIHSFSAKFTTQFTKTHGPSHELQRVVEMDPFKHCGNSIVGFVELEDPAQSRRQTAFIIRRSNII